MPFGVLTAVVRHGVLYGLRQRMIDIVVCRIYCNICFLLFSFLFVCWSLLVLLSQCWIGGAIFYIARILKNNIVKWSQPVCLFSHTFIVCQPNHLFWNTRCPLVRTSRRSLPRLKTICCSNLYRSTQKSTIPHRINIKRHMCVMQHGKRVPQNAIEVVMINWGYDVVILFASV